VSDSFRREGPPGRGEHTIQWPAGKRRVGETEYLSRDQLLRSRVRDLAGERQASFASDELGAAGALRAGTRLGADRGARSRANPSRPTAPCFRSSSLPDCGPLRDLSHRHRSPHGVRCLRRATAQEAGPSASRAGGLRPGRPDRRLTTGHERGIVSPTSRRFVITTSLRKGTLRHGRQRQHDHE
jgi:hypothetical protein